MDFYFRFRENRGRADHISKISKTPEFKASIALTRIVRPGGTGSAEKSAEAFLLKMPVVGENVGQPFPSHRLH